MKKSDEKTYLWQNKGFDKAVCTAFMDPSKQMVVVGLIEGGTIKAHWPPKRTGSYWQGQLGPKENEFLRKGMKKYS